MCLSLAEISSVSIRKEACKAVEYAVSPAVILGGSCTLSCIFGKNVCRHWSGVSRTQAALSVAACSRSVQAMNNPWGVE